MGRMVTATVGAHRPTCSVRARATGKTSALGMLTGLIRPSAGECFVMGHSLAAAPAAARAHIGYCPQSNVLFDALTPREHLALFGAVKGLASRAARAEAAASMLQVRLPVWDVLFDLPGRAAGGMR